MTDEEYFALGANFENMYISASCLKHIDPEQGGSPIKFKKYFTDPKATTSKAMEFGKLLHKFYESPEEFIVSEVPKPSDMMCVWVEAVKAKMPKEGILHSVIRNSVDLDEETQSDFNKAMNSAVLSAKTETGVYSSIKKTESILEKFKAEGSAYLYALIGNEGLISITIQQKKDLDACVISLQRNSRVSEFIFGDVIKRDEEGHITFERLGEQTILWNYKEQKCKSKLDNIAIDRENKKIIVIDLKTTSDPLSLFKWSFRNYRIYRQLAFYKKAVEQQYENFIKEGYSVEFGVIVCETTAPHECGFYLIESTDEWIKKGEREIDNLFARIREHQDTGNWTEPIEVTVNNGYYSLPRPDEMK